MTTQNENLEILLPENKSQISQREEWNELEYYLLIIGTNVGIGCVWRFSYLMFENGGGAFLIPYIFATFVITYPALSMLNVMGQQSEEGLFSVYQKINIKYGGLAFTKFFYTFMVSTFYIYLMVYNVIFMYDVIIGHIPWFTTNQKDLIFNLREYFENEIISENEIGEGIGKFNFRMLIFVIFCYMILLIIIIKGIKVSGKVALFTVTGPYILLTILFIRILFLKGSFKGMLMVVVPRFKELFTFKPWQDGLNQAFFQNGIGYGVLIGFATFRKKSIPIQKSSIIIVLANFVSSVFAALIVFGYLGYLLEETGLSLEELPLTGPTLIFVTYPASLSLMPFARFWLVLFFFTMILLTIDTQLGFLEFLCYYVIDMRDWMNKYKNKNYTISNEVIRVIVCGISLVIGLFFCFQSGFRSMNFVNFFATVISTCLGLIIDIFLFYYSGIFKEKMKDAAKLTNEKLSLLVTFSLKYLIIPSTFLIMISWIWQSPSIFREAKREGNYMGIYLGIFFNIFILLPSFIFFFFNK